MCVPGASSLPTHQPDIGAAGGGLWGVWGLRLPPECDNTWVLTGWEEVSRQSPWLAPSACLFPNTQVRIREVASPQGKWSLSLAGPRLCLDSLESHTGVWPSSPFNTLSHPAADMNHIRSREEGHSS